MLRMCDRSRKILAVMGAVSAVASFACIPKNVHSAGVQQGLESADVVTHRRSTLPAAAASGAFIDDPFSRWKSKQPRPSRVASNPVPAVPVRVRAIIEGRRTLALIQEGDATRIVSTGERVAGSSIADIRSDALWLANGTQLKIDGTIP